MLVLKEDALPYHIDPITLETLGRWGFHGKWTATSMSARPKIDPVTGEMIAYSYQAKGDLSDDVAVYTVSPRVASSRPCVAKTSARRAGDIAACAATRSRG